MAVKQRTSLQRFLTQPLMLLMAVGLTARAKPTRIYASDFRFFGSAGTETHITLADPNSPLNPGNFLGIQKVSNASDLVLFGEVIPEDKSWKFHFKLRGESDRQSSWTARGELSELYLSISVTRWLDLQAGRKIEKWGTGYAWNPTGVVNPAKNPSDPNDRRNVFRGVDMLGADLFVKGWNVSLLAVPQLDWSKRSGAFLVSTGWAARAYKLVKDTDLSLTFSGGKGLPTHQGVSASRVFGNALELHAEVAAFQDDLRVVPASRAIESGGRRSAQVLLGGQYTFPHNVNLIAEYFHSGAGLDQREWDQFREEVRDGQMTLRMGDATPLLQQNLWFAPLRMGQNYSFGRLSWPIRLNKLELEVMTITSLRDGSSIIRPGITWKFHPNWSLYWLQSRFVGGVATEFGQLQVSQTSDFGLRFSF